MPTSLSKPEWAAYMREKRKEPTYRARHAAYMRRYRNRGMALALKRKARAMFEQY